MRRVTFDSILVQPDAVCEIGPRFYTALPEVAAAAPHDRKAVVYDAIVGRSLYHRIFVAAREEPGCSMKGVREPVRRS